MEDHDGYSTRSGRHFVISGPIGNYRGRGRRFSRPQHAVIWARRKYGADNVRLLPESTREGAVRWVILVKGVL